MPLPGSRIITDRMLAAVGTVEAAARPCTITITRPGTGRVYNPDLDAFADPEPTVIGVAVPARVTPEKPRAHVAEHGDQQITESRYLVSIDRDLDQVLLDDELVTDDSGDPNLDGRTLKVVEVIGSTTGTAQRALCHLVNT